MRILDKNNLGRAGRQDVLESTVANYKLAYKGKWQF